MEEGSPLCVPCSSLTLDSGSSLYCQGHFDVQFQVPGAKVSTLPELEPIELRVSNRTSKELAPDQDAEKHPGRQAAFPE